MIATIEDWTDLRFLLAVVEGGTLAAAARELGVDQSTVFRRIGALENRLATKLFAKRGRGYVLTQAGEELGNSARRIEEEVRSAERRLGGRDSELKGTVRLTTSESIAHGLVLPAIPAFRRAAPGVHIELLLADRFFSLGRGDADVALRAGPRPSEPDVIPRSLGSMPNALYVSRDYDASGGFPNSLADLKDHDFVGMERHTAAGPFGAYVDALADPSRIVCRCSSLMSAFRAIETGVGLGVLPRFLGDASPALTRLALKAPGEPSPIWLVLHQDLRQTARVRAFVDFLSDALTATIVG